MDGNYSSITNLEWELQSLVRVVVFTGDHYFSYPANFEGAFVPLKPVHGHSVYSSHLPGMKPSQWEMNSIILISICKYRIAMILQGRLRKLLKIVVVVSVFDLCSNLKR